MVSFNSRSLLTRVSLIKSEVQVLNILYQMFGQSGQNIFGEHMITLKTGNQSDILGIFNPTALFTTSRDSAQIGNQ